MPITFTGFHHAGVLVTDVERAAKFYETILGLENLERPDFGFPGRWYDLRNGLQLHLLGTNEIPEHSTNLPRFDRHIALQVPDLQKTAEELTALGVEYSVGTGRGGAAQIFLRDPDGNMIELR